MTNKAAQELGRLGKGKPKTLSKAERKRRAERLAKAREKRWADKANDQVDGRGILRPVERLVGTDGGET